MTDAPEYQIVVVAGGVATVVARAPRFDDKAKAEAWAAAYEAAEPPELKNTSARVVVRVAPPERKQFP